MAPGALGRLFVFFLLWPAACATDFPGKYVIKNAASGRRLGNSGLGFFATTYGPISEEHMWRLHEEGNNSFSLSNVVSGSRILAQSGYEGAQGFFAVADGPVYQDQKWHLMMQTDGTFVIANAKSGRRIWAQDEGGSGASFGASQSPPEAQAWWLIRQDLDESRLLRAELAAERQSRALLAAKVQERDAELETFRQQVEAGCPAGDTQQWYLPDPRLLGVLAWGGGDGKLFLYLLAGLLMLGLQLQKKRWAGPRKEDTPAVPEGPEPGLGQDFGYHLLDTEVNGATVRMVKIQCPGVEHEDVSVDLLFNGCQVRLSRRAACGVAAAAWAKRFEFPTHEGIFEFWEDQMRLEHGFLHLIFRMRPFHSRRVRFPRHYTLTATDTDDWWDYPGAAVPAGKEAANLADSHVQDPRKVTPA